MEFLCQIAKKVDQVLNFTTFWGFVKFHHQLFFVTTGGKISPLLWNFTTSGDTGCKTKDLNNRHFCRHDYASVGCANPTFLGRKLLFWKHCYSLNILGLSILNFYDLSLNILSQCLQMWWNFTKVVEICLPWWQKKVDGGIGFSASADLIISVRLQGGG